LNPFYDRIEKNGRPALYVIDSDTGVSVWEWCPPVIPSVWIDNYRHGAVGLLKDYFFGVRRIDLSKRANEQATELVIETLYRKLVTRIHKEHSAT